MRPTTRFIIAWASLGMSACGSGVISDGTEVPSSITNGSTEIEIVGYGSKCLEAGGGGAAGGPVQIWDCDGSAIQKWRIQHTQLVSASGECVQVAGGKSENFAQLELAACRAGEPTQSWQFAGQEIVDGSRRCFDIGRLPGTREVDTRNGTRVQIWDCWGGENQKWTMRAAAASGSPAPAPPPKPAPPAPAPPPTPSSPRAPTCTSFTYSAWGPCQPNGRQTRTVVSASPRGCTGGSPILTQSCHYVPPRCTSFTYSAWGPCQPNGTQTRTVVSASPPGCTGGSTILTQACVYIDGAALYRQYCSGCHGNAKKGRPASAIQNAINNNVGGMHSLSFLTREQIAAIAASH